MSCIALLEDEDSAEKVTEKLRYNLREVWFVMARAEEEMRQTEASGRFKIVGKSESDLFSRDSSMVLSWLCFPRGKMLVDTIEIAKAARGTFN